MRDRSEQSRLGGSIVACGQTPRGQSSFRRWRGIRGRHRSRLARSPRFASSVSLGRRRRQAASSIRDGYGLCTAVSISARAVRPEIVCAPTAQRTEAGRSGRQSGRRRVRWVSLASEPAVLRPHGQADRPRVRDPAGVGGGGVRGEAGSAEREQTGRGLDRGLCGLVHVILGAAERRPLGMGSLYWVLGAGRRTVAVGLVILVPWSFVWHRCRRQGPGHSWPLRIRSASVVQRVPRGGRRISDPKLVALERCGGPRRCRLAIGPSTCRRAPARGKRLRSLPRSGTVAPMPEALVRPTPRDEVDSPHQRSPVPRPRLSRDRGAGACREAVVPQLGVSKWHAGACRVR